MDIACSKNIKNILEKIAIAENGVLFHCSAGKDRTGVITAIIFMLCDVLENEIINDYMMSNENLKIKLEEIKIKNSNVDLNVVVPRESYVIEFMKTFYDKFGDINKYMDFIGLDNYYRIKIENKLLKE